MSHSHCQLYLTALLSRSVDIQGDGNSSLKPSPAGSMGLCMEFSVLLAARGRWSQMVWGWSQEHWLQERQKGNVSGDLEQETLRKSLKSSVQKPVN